MKFILKKEDTATLEMRSSRVVHLLVHADILASVPITNEDSLIDISLATPVRVVACDGSEHTIPSECLIRSVEIQGQEVRHE
jgi:hypothetical protein